MDKIVKKAYSKINLTLDVTGLRDDGYHTVGSVMQMISLHDEITMSKLGSEGIKLSSGAYFIPCDRRNSAWKAAEEFYKLRPDTGKDGVRISVRKHIPVGGGMGGGSADAAAVLIGMNELFDAGLTKEELCAAGAKIGADVPFCILGGTAFAAGIGTELTPLTPLPDCSIVICRPDYSCSTPEIYRRWDKQKRPEHPDHDGFLSSLEKGDLRGITRRLFNVFEGLLPERSGDILEIKNLMYDNGSLGASMTGTGSVIFGIFENESNAKSAADQLCAMGLKAMVCAPQPKPDMN